MTFSELFSLFMTSALLILLGIDMALILLNRYSTDMGIIAIDSDNIILMSFLIFLDFCWNYYIFSINNITSYESLTFIIHTMYYISCMCHL